MRWVELADTVAPGRTDLLSFDFGAPCPLEGRSLRLLLLTDQGLQPRRLCQGQGAILDLADEPIEEMG